jgi:hypothetical protein
MAARWATTYKMKTENLSAGNYWDDGEYIDTNLPAFYERRYALIRPNRAYLALKTWHNQGSVKWEAYPVDSGGSICSS